MAFIPFAFPFAFSPISYKLIYVHAQTNINVFSVFKTHRNTFAIIQRFKVVVAVFVKSLIVSEHRNIEPEYVFCFL